MNRKSSLLEIYQRCGMFGWMVYHARHAPLVSPLRCRSKIMRPLRLCHAVPYLLPLRVSRRVVVLGRDDQDDVVSHQS